MGIKNIPLEWTKCSNERGFLLYEINVGKPYTVSFLYHEAFWKSRSPWYIRLCGLFVSYSHSCIHLTRLRVILHLYVLGNGPCSPFCLCRKANRDCWQDILKNYCAVLLEGAIIVLACVIFSVFASSPPTVDASAAAATHARNYIGIWYLNL